MENEKREHHEPHIVHAQGSIHHAIPVHSKKKPGMSTINYVLMGLFLAVLVFNQFMIFQLSSSIGAKVAEATEAARPASIQIATITDNNCPDCFSLAPALASLKQGNVNATSEKNFDASSNEAKELISKNGLEFIPAVVVTGEINKTEHAGFVIKNGVLLLGKPTPPYYDLARKKIIGKVALTIINDSACSKCSKLAPIVLQLKAAGVSISSEKTIDSSSEEAKALIEKYKIEKLPSLMLSEDASSYEIMKQAWLQMGTVEKDGVHVMRSVNPPYVEVATGKIKGLVALTVLNDSSCRECYDATRHVQILQNGYGVVLESQKTVDISSAEGKELVKKYSITGVPTIIYYGAEPYESLKQPWLTVGSIEKDGAYIFRDFTNWQGNAYKDLTTGKVNPNPVQKQ